MSGSPSRGITSVTYTVTASRHSGFLLTSPALLRDFELADYLVGGARQRHGGGSQYTNSQRHPELQPGDRWPPGGTGEGDHSGRRLRPGIGRGHRDAARRVRLRVQRPEGSAGVSLRKRPECQVHPPGGHLRHLHRHRLRDGWLLLASPALLRDFERADYTRGRRFQA